ncbi:hypothetical protein KHQ81_10895 [Mycoplasmatota bacterium]|nr:hypothetical protein KHQ81_10895 [Mycoplasmatota bacterium]
MSKEVEYTKEEKLLHFGERMNDDSLTDGQRKYAKNRYNQILEGNDYAPYSLEEKRQFHTKRAKKDSINPKTNKKYTKAERSRSRGYLQALKNISRAFKFKNPDYKSKKY